MKYAIILPDGAADHPQVSLDGRTPLQAARIPNMDWISQNGQLGQALTIPPGFAAGTDVGTLSLFGYDPREYYSGRAPLEAAARNLKAGPDELIFRCNFVTILDGRMADFTAGHVSQDEADRLIADMNALFAGDPIQFHAGVSYRNLLIAGHAADMQLRCAPPHDIPNQPVDKHGPSGAGSDRVNNIMERAAGMLANHAVNETRRREGRDPVTGIWLWGQGRPTRLPTLHERFGLAGVTITAVDIIRGIAVCMGMKLIEVEGATGYIDTNYRGKGQAAVAALDDYDVVVAHVEAPDEAGHLGDPAEKVLALERVDEQVVGPLLEAVRKRDRWRILVAADHPTPCDTKIHESAPPPFCFAGDGIEAVERRPYDEPNAKAGGFFINPGHGLLDQFIR